MDIKSSREMTEVEIESWKARGLVLVNVGELDHDSKKQRQETSLVVQWLRLYPQCRGSGRIPGHGTRSHIPQLKIP